jgi:predicted nucleic acid-binding protein
VLKIVVDTYAWVELFLGSEKGKQTKEILENAEEIFTPSIVLAEAARKFFREGNDENTIAEWLDIISSASNIIQIDQAVALEAAKCNSELVERAKRFKQNTPSLFDAIVLATARINQCKILTGDGHFKDLPETMWLR